MLLATCYLLLSSSELLPSWYLGFDTRDALERLACLVFRLSRDTKGGIQPVAELQELLPFIHCLVTVAVTLRSPLFGGRSLAHRSAESLWKDVEEVKENRSGCAQNA